VKINEIQKMSVADKHQLKIAEDILKMSDSGALVMER